MPKITDFPDIEVHIIDNEEKAGGVGEPGLATVYASAYQCNFRPHRKTNPKTTV